MFYVLYFFFEHVLKTHADLMYLKTKTICKIFNLFAIVTELQLVL